MNNMSNKTKAKIVIMFIEVLINIALINWLKSTFEVSTLTTYSYVVLILIMLWNQSSAVSKHIVLKK